MSAVPPLKLRALLERVLGEVLELRGEVRALHAEARRTNAAADLLVALEEFFGDGRFTVSGVLDAAEEHPAIADAIAGFVDMNGSPRSRATALGSRLRRLAGVEVVAERRGAAVYKLRTLGG